MFWRTTYERINYGFSPPLRQIVDIVFDTDIPFDNEHLEAFEGAAWHALKSQMPSWSDPHGPMGTGWSTVLGGNKFDPAVRA